MSKFSVLFLGADLYSHSIRNQILVWGILIGGILLIACLGMLIRSTAPVIKNNVTKKPLPGKSKVMKNPLPGKAGSTKGALAKKLPNRPADYASKDWLNYRQKLAPFLESGRF